MPQPFTEEVVASLDYRRRRPMLGLTYETEDMRYGYIVTIPRIHPTTLSEITLRVRFIGVYPEVETFE
jgi:hypothetical protein